MAIGPFGFAPILRLFRRSTENDSAQQVRNALEKTREAVVATTNAKP